MKLWFQKNVWWLGIVITLAIAFFPQAFALVGNLMAKYLSVYWLQGSIVVIVVLLSLILKQLCKKDKHTL
ncbi:hypothetical protein GOP56_17190 [Brevibacillus sp. 7WMA2]|uniref:hypothetical protein n=1 Tax=Brevibacillus sp. 7WMA2 TaxID=2683193 RepID=UPI0013A740B0|nr:hypothetical protein [Brevibacillus sp. 7WMA2]QIC07178.1 hypothetical protein GOP56_17190 [Brevibacillus sp. 7WMA2]